MVRNGENFQTESCQSSVLENSTKADTLPKYCLHLLLPQVHQSMPQLYQIQSNLQKINSKVQLINSIWTDS